VDALHVSPAIRAPGIICVPVATTQDNRTRCAVCRRSLLVGELARIYQDARTRGVQSVCPLCTAKAERMGWQLVGEEQARRPLQVLGDGHVDHERLVSRLQADLERLERDLGGKQRELDGERATRAATASRISELAAALENVEGELDRTRAKLAEADRRTAEVERRLTESQQAQEVLLRARRREADAAYLCAIGVEAFNRSEHVDALRGLVAEHGEPLVRVGVEGVGLPRQVRVICDFPDGRASYRVSCDLVARIFDVEDLSHGGRLLPLNGSFEPNARIEGGRLAFAPES
jgi:hypothetical protein